MRCRFGVLDSSLLVVWLRVVGGKERMASKKAEVLLKGDVFFSNQMTCRKEMPKTKGVKNEKTQTRARKKTSVDAV